MRFKADKNLISSATLRGVLHSAYTFVRSQEVNKAASALTLDHLLQEQITALDRGATQEFVDGKGVALGTRSSKLDRLDKLKADLAAVVKQIKEADGNVDKLQAMGIFEAGGK